jgi:transmembrane sensor
MENLGKYFENKQFVQQIFAGTPESEDWLDQFEAANPAERDDVRLARRIIMQFRTKKKALTEEEKMVIFSKVIHELENKRQQGGMVLLMRGLLKYAAVALIFFSIGALVFHKKQSINPEFFTQGFPEATGSSSAKLIRSDGEDILLSRDNPVIEYNSSGDLQIDSQTVESRQGNAGKEGNLINQLIIPYGKTSRITLSDGTRVNLNAGSRLVYPEIFTGPNREVLLTGEAFFEVTHDVAKPFVVQTADVRIKVLGTRFNLSAYASDNYIEAVLAEGKISMDRNKAGIFEKATEISPGQMASFSRVSSEISLRTVEIDDFISWKDGVYKFESTHLNRILKRLERYYNISFQFRDAFLGTLQISGKLELKEELSETLERIARAAQVKIEKTQEGIYEVKK